VGLRFFNVYGPNEYQRANRNQEQHAKYLPACRARTASDIDSKSDNRNYPDGGQMRDFIYVKDCANIVTWLLRKSPSVGNFQRGKPALRVSVQDLAHAVFSKLGMNLLRLPPTTTCRKGSNPDIRYLATEAKMDRLRGAGYTAPSTSLEVWGERLCAEFPYASG